jgi:hypothetical protein
VRALSFFGGPNLNRQKPNLLLASPLPKHLPTFSDHQSPPGSTQFKDRARFTHDRLNPFSLLAVGDLFFFFFPLFILVVLLPAVETRLIAKFFSPRSHLSNV